MMVLLGVALLVALGYIWQGGKADGAGGVARDVQMMRCVCMCPSLAAFEWVINKCTGLKLPYGLQRARVGVGGAAGRDPA